MKELFLNYLGESRVIRSLKVERGCTVPEEVIVVSVGKTTYQSCFQGRGQKPRDMGQFSKARGVNSALELCERSGSANTSTLM